MKSIRTLVLTVLAACMVTLAACDMAPRFVKESAEIDAYLSQRRWSSACVGLTMKKDDSLRQYAAERLVTYPHIKTTTDCICAAVYDAEKHTIDAVVVSGLKGSERDDLAACVIPALSDAAITGKDRTELVRVLGDMEAKSAYESLENLVSSDSDAETRAYAAAALRPSGGSVPVLLKALQEDAEPGVRAAAAGALTGRKDKEVEPIVVKAALEDTDGGVRAAALGAVVKKKSSRTDDMVCKMMMDDPDERVRDVAVRAFHGTKRASAIKCLQARVMKEEDSSMVRDSLFKALGASPSDRAALVLCEAIGPVMRMYVTDKLQDHTPGTNIIETQNNRDWERSFDCVKKALSQGGYSCYARNHLGHWMNTLGGKASTPRCPGM
jgi:hypothetical protein